MKRRPMLLAAGSATLCGALAALRAHAQPGKEPRRIGMLGIGSVAGGSTLERALLDGLRAHGYLQGRDIVLDARWGGGRTEVLAQLAAQLAATRPAVFVTLGPQATQAVLAADADAAVVALLGDAVESGFAAQLGRPGGRVTGMSFLGTPLNANVWNCWPNCCPRAVPC